MSLPQRPTPASPGSNGRRESYHRNSPRRNRPQDVETGGYYSPANASPRGNCSPTRKSDFKAQAHVEALPSPRPTLEEKQPLRGMASGDDGAGAMSRKRSLIRPERNRIDRDHPNYYYRQHAQNMPVYPSTTGNDPIFEDHAEAETASSGSTDLKSMNPEGHRDQQYQARTPRRGTRRDRGAGPDTEPFSREPRGDAKLQRRLTRKETKILEAEEKVRQKERDAVRPISFWTVYCALITFWCPNAVLRCFGKLAKAQQRAWREKMGLISIILLICGFVGFLTFGFTETVCGTPGLRLKINHVDTGYMIFHGSAYDLSESIHPPAQGIPPGSNILYDLPQKYGGMDGSFMFQNVNGQCKGLINLAPKSDVPTNAAGGLAWYFPCTAFKQDGSSKPNLTIPYNLGYACHTSQTAREKFYGLRSAGEVYFTWEDIKNSSRNLMVYSGDVLDLDLLRWFNSSEVTVPSAFEALRTNEAVRGVDVTHAFQSSEDKQIARCLSEIIRVGSIDTETVGCIASKVVLYVSLVFILSIVMVKFFLALFFGWIFSRRFAASKSSFSLSKGRRNKQIEEWSDDIYRGPPKLVDAGNATPDRSSKRGSTLFPQTSRFTSPYAMEKAMAKSRTRPTTMASQSSTSRLAPPNPLYTQNNGSQSSLHSLEGGSQGMTGASRSSLLLSARDDGRLSGMFSDSEGPGPAGFIHEAVVPQPPPEWQPFGYPLAHTICLVTAYSEGAAGLRTTMDSIATTEYPNSHKTIVVICDGLIKGKGEEFSTPEIALSMIKDHALLPDEVQAFSYVAVASGSKRHNMAKVYAGFYDYGHESAIRAEKQQRVPLLVVVKCGTPDEADRSKPGNRGKRDSQIILMSFLQKVMFDERMTELEFEMFNGLWKVTGMSPDFYETVLMVDADTKIFPDSITHMISAMVKDPEIMGLCGETKIANKRASWVSMIQVFE
jgi:chitin synthase